MEKQLKILSIGAHPDDADTYSGGLLSKLRDAGWLVRLLSVTDGSAGTYHMDESAEELKLKRAAKLRRAVVCLAGGMTCWIIRTAGWRSRLRPANI